MLLRHSGLVLVVLCCVVGPLHAQRVAGRVLDETTGRPVVGAIVTVVDSASTRSVIASSDSLGEWGATVRSSGRYRVTVERLGYTRIETDPFLVGPTTVFLDLRTIPEIIALEPLSASATNLAGLLARSQTNRSVRTLLPEDVDRRIQRLKASTTSELLRTLVAGLGVRYDGDWPKISGVPLMLWEFPSRGLSFGATDFRAPFGPNHQSFRRSCNAIIALDGVPVFYGRPETILERVVPLQEVRAVEVFNDPNYLPRELALEERRNPADPPIQGQWNREPEARCGVVAIWTRAGLGIP